MFLYKFKATSTCLHLSQVRSPKSQNSDICSKTKPVTSHHSQTTQRTDSLLQSPHAYVKKTRKNVDQNVQERHVKTLPRKKTSLNIYMYINTSSSSQYFKITLQYGLLKKRLCARSWAFVQENINDIQIYARNQRKYGKWK